MALANFVIHKPVLLNEVLNLLNIKPDGVYFDGTFGRGGHSLAILERLNTHGRLIACDKDLEAIEYANAHIHDSRFTLVHGNFVTVASQLEAQATKLDGVLLDLGVSSPQLDTASRGFSFRFGGELDMRMDTTGGISAREWLSSVSEEELASVLWRYGEERYSRKIAHNVVVARESTPITHTLQLAEIIASSVPGYQGKQHKATKSFQAIRIFINHELDDLKQALEKCPQLLNVDGRMVVISFHSLEDRLVKTTFNALSQSPILPRWVMVDSNHEMLPAYKVIAKKVRASDVEVSSSSRSRSAVMRCLARVRVDNLESSQS